MHQNTYSKFTTNLKVRPDDIDMFNHVHSSKYLDYVLAARYEQMEKCYHLSMEEFRMLGLGWVIKSFNINYKRALTVGCEISVSTQIITIQKRSCSVVFEIKNKLNDKIYADGNVEFVMINLSDGKPTLISQDIIYKYSI